MSNYISSWLETYAERATYFSYRSALRNFLAYIYNVEQNGSEEEWEQLAGKYIDECRGKKRDPFKDLLGFAAALHERPPKTARLYSGAVKGWLEFTLDLEFTRKQMRMLRGRLPKGSKARTEEAELTREVLRRIISHCDLKGKALFLFLSSSGIRIGEALQIQIDDVDLDSNPAKVKVRGEYTKTGDGYTTFISREAKELLLEWLKVRDQYLQSAVNRGRGLQKLGRGTKAADDDRVFPFSDQVAYQMWTNAVKKAQMEKRDRNTNRRTLHIHMLRKWFQSQMKYAGVPEDVVEALIGHSGYLDDAYRRYTLKQIAELYSKAEPYLYVNVPREISEIQTHFQSEVEELRQRVEDLTRKLTDANTIALQQMNENMRLKEELRRLEERMLKIERILGEFKRQHLKAS